nr:MAG TPA: putative zinc-ribbon domain protein [Caudoviricetes sp.]
MSKYKKEIKHCEKCNKPFSVFPNSTETLCTSCKRDNLEETLCKNGHAPKHTLVRNIYDGIKETFAVEDAARRASRDGDTSIEKTCRDCGKVFAISRSERIFFESHNMALPKRCPACRKARKEARKENN